MSKRVAIIAGVAIATLSLVGCSDKPAPATPPAQDLPAAPEQGMQVDPTSGLKIADGWETVRANCVACHSGLHFLRQTGTRDSWQDAIHWMQRTQGLWPLAPEVENVILDYLATNYAPTVTDYRRAPLPWTQLPPNPYGTPIPTTKPPARAAPAPPR